MVNLRDKATLRRMANSFLLCTVAVAFSGACDAVSPIRYSCTDAGTAATTALQKELKSAFASITKTEVIMDCDSGGDQSVIFSVTSNEAAGKEFAATSKCRPQPADRDGLVYICRLHTVSADVLLVRAPHTSNQAVARPNN